MRGMPVRLELPVAVIIVLAMNTPILQYVTAAQGRIQIAFNSFRDGNGEIYIMNEDGSEQKRLTTHPATDFAPRFGPDGTKIVFSSHRDGNANVYVMGVDGSNQRRLTSDPAFDGNAEFSPDGGKIVFNSNRDGRFEVYLMSADGTRQVRLTAHPETCKSSSDICGNVHPTFSPDGKKIAFASDRDGNFELYVMNVDGSEQRRLTSVPARDWQVRFIPDGRIAFTSNRSGESQIYLMNVDGSGVVGLTDGPRNNFTPAACAGSRKMVFASDRDGHVEIYAMSIEGSNQVRLTNSPPRNVTPDCR